MKGIIVMSTLWMIFAECSTYYVQRGWRPQGRAFNPSNNQVDAHSWPSAPLIYGSGSLPTRQPTFATTTMPANTTPKSREPTTVSDVPEEDDFESNPALAVANSFAFNRPVYVINTFPIYNPGRSFFK